MVASRSAGNACHPFAFCLSGGAREPAQTGLLEVTKDQEKLVSTLNGRKSRYLLNFVFVTESSKLVQ
jgi:hypothetical protein